MIHQACERKGCTPDDLLISATFDDHRLAFVTTKLKVEPIEASLLKRIWKRLKKGKK